MIYAGNPGTPAFFGNPVYDATRETTVAEVLSMEVQDIPTARLTIINQVVANRATAVETIIGGATEPNLIDILTQALDAPPIVIDSQPTTDLNPQ